MRVLIVHHFESMWAHTMKALFGISFEDFADKLRSHIENSDNYDRVILTRFEGDELEDFHYECDIAHLIHAVEEYAYGWVKSMFRPDHEGITWTTGGNHSEVVWLAPFLHDLQLSSAQVDLCGAFDGECIEDMEIALSALNIPYKRLENLIVG